MGLVANDAAGPPRRLVDSHQEGLLRFAPGPVSSLPAARPKSTYTLRNGLRSDSIFRLFEDSRGRHLGGDLRRRRQRTRPDRSRHGRRPRIRSPDGLHDDVLTRARPGRRSVRRRMDRVPGRPIAPVSRPVRGDSASTPATRSETTSFEAVGSILADRHGRIWLASTAHGLGRIDDPGAAVPAIRWYGEADGLSRRTRRGSSWRIRQATCSSAPDVASTVSIPNGRFTHYSADDGVPRGEIWGGLRDRSGGIWLATTDGVARFDPRTETAARPVTLITAIRVGGMPLPARADGAQRFDGLTVQAGRSSSRDRFRQPWRADRRRVAVSASARRRRSRLDDHRRAHDRARRCGAGNVTGFSSRDLRRRHRDRSRGGRVHRAGAALAAPMVPRPRGRLRVRRGIRRPPLAGQTRHCRRTGPLADCRRPARWRRREPVAHRDPERSRPAAGAFGAAGRDSRADRDQRQRPRRDRRHERRGVVHRSPGRQPATGGHSRPGHGVGAVSTASASDGPSRPPTARRRSRSHRSSDATSI